MKSSVDNLAYFGGIPSFPHPLHVGRPNVGNREELLKRIAEVLDSRWFTNDGAEVKEFERRVAIIAGVRNCVAMCNATTALQIAICAAGLTGEVIVPSFTFVATAHSLQWQGITPVFCDIDETFCLDPEKVEELITPKTSAVIGVHLWGQTCNVEALAAICKKHNLALLFDAAHAFGCSRHGVAVGSFGRAEVFSFHATKFINTFEGGAVVTNDDQFANTCRAMRNFGFSGEDEVSALGINGKMNEIEAVMGLTSLDSMDEIIAVNRRNYLDYRRGLDKLPGISLITREDNELNNFQYIVVRVAEEAGISRNLLHELLNAEGVLARRYFSPGCHRMEPYRSLYPSAGKCLPRTESACESILCLPTGTSVSSEDIDRICALLRYLASDGAKIQSRLSLRSQEIVVSGITK